MSKLRIVFAVVLIAAGLGVMVLQRPAEVATAIVERNAAVDTLNGGDAELLAQQTVHAARQRLIYVPVATGALLIVMGAVVLTSGSKRSSTNSTTGEGVKPCSDKCACGRSH